MLGFHFNDTLKKNENTQEYVRSYLWLLTETAPYAFLCPGSGQNYILNFYVNFQQKNIILVTFL